MSSRDLAAGCAEDAFTFDSSRYLNCPSNLTGHDHPNKPANGVGNNGTFCKWTGAALGQGAAKKINKETPDVSGAHRPGYGDTGGRKRDPRRVVRTRSVLGERAVRRGQSRRGTQTVSYTHLRAHETD